MTAGKLLPPTTIYPCFKEGPLLILKYNVDKKNQGCPPTTQNSLYWTKKNSSLWCALPSKYSNENSPCVTSRVELSYHRSTRAQVLCLGLFWDIWATCKSAWQHFYGHFINAKNTVTVDWAFLSKACHRFTLSHLSLSTWVDLRYISNKEISKLLF